ncbi:hypothetical protein QBC34DRAFT_489678 [Podospora aff. communis PSN243]|uniref:Uncharacterized protein n=1 Tax=Podospora aff. communis PSN243 TaxID=3040156 RepID=A0AAV9H4N4_9PEZI|nr:hypothetical protein QBC34DRAFT_489678 [Podospora aff. communis PSN243]
MATSELGDSLTKPHQLSETAQAEIARAFWNAKVEIRGRNSTLYFNHYCAQCYHFNHRTEGRTGVKTHNDVILVAQDINQGLARTEIVKKRASDPADPEEIQQWNHAVDLVARLMCMLDVGHPSLGGHSVHPEGEFIPWTDGSLAGLIASLPHFQRSDSLDGSQLTFTAHKLDTVAGLHVVWTTNLAHHLLLRGEDEVLIFNQVWFLKSLACSKSPCLFPEGLVEETLRTLALLFGSQPSNKIRRWYNRLLRLQYGEISSDGMTDDCIFECGPVYRDIGEYRYWQKRLDVLEKRYRDRPSVSLKQLWNDRRDGIQWYFLWVSLGLTVFFGFVQSVEGALQVYKAFNE